MDNVTVNNMRELCVALNQHQGKTFQRAKMIRYGLEMEFSNLGYTSTILINMSEESVPIAAPVPEPEEITVITEEAVIKKRGRPFAKAY